MTSRFIVFVIVLLFAVVVLADEHPAAVNLAADIPSSSILLAEIRNNLSAIEQNYHKLSDDLRRTMCVKMRLSPRLSLIGEPVQLQMEVLSDKTPNDQIELYLDYIAERYNPAKKITLVKLNWTRANDKSISGLDVYRAAHTFALAQPGSYLLHWICDIGGDISEFWRPFAVVDNNYAVCLFESTSHRTPPPYQDFHDLHVPYDYWDARLLDMVSLANFKGPAAHWAQFSCTSRQFGVEPTPMLWVCKNVFKDVKPQIMLSQLPDQVQSSLFSAFQKFWPCFGFDNPNLNCFASYMIGTSTVRAAAVNGLDTISALCAWQNWTDGNMKINHAPLPERPYFISPEDFRKIGPGGKNGIVGINQCQRHILNHDYDCTYVLEPAWNIFNKGDGRTVYDDISLSRQYDFFEAMLQNRISQSVPYIFSVGIEFNGVLPGITESNRLFIKYAAQKTKNVPLVFSTGPAVADFFCRHYQKNPETTCYLQDYFGGQVVNGKPPGYPDTLEIEGPFFKSLFKENEILPYFHYDYLTEWDYPDWDHTPMPRNKLGYPSPDLWDRFQELPRIVDTRNFEVSRSDTQNSAGFHIKLSVQAKKAQRNMAFALWNIPRQWSKDSDWWSASNGCRFVPVRAPYTHNLNGILVADILEGANTFSLTINAPPRPLQETTFKISDLVEGRVFFRDDEYFSYFWPTKPKDTTLTITIPPSLFGNNRKICVYMPPEGNEQKLKAGETSFLIKTPDLNVRWPLTGWCRLIGLSIDEIKQYCTAK